MLKLLFAVPLLVFRLFSQGIQPTPAEKAFIDAFRQHRIVMLGEIHENLQLHKLLLTLIANRAFAEELDDIVLEGANPLYQAIADRYVFGQNVPIEELQQVWRNGLALGIVPDKPIAELYAAVRTTNQRYRRRIRILGGEAPVDWTKVQSRADLEPFVPKRDEYYAHTVSQEVLSRNHRALLIMGLLHFRRKNDQPQLIEKEIQKAGVVPWLVLTGSNIIGSYEEVDRRFEQSPWPAVYPVKGTWIGALQAVGPLTGGVGRPIVEGTLEQACDAYLFVGPRDSLTQFRVKRSDVLGTAYAKEMERRLTIIFGRVPPDFLPKDDRDEWPQYQPRSVAPPPIPARK